MMLMLGDLMMTHDSCEKSGSHRQLVTSVLHRAGRVKEVIDSPRDVPDANVKCADARNHRWPIERAEDLLESAVSVELQKEAMHPDMFRRVMGAIQKRAYGFGMLADLGQVRDMARTERDAAVKSASKLFPIVFWATDSTRIEYDVSTKEATLSSAAAFIEDAGLYTVPARAHLAAGLLKAAKDNGFPFNAETIEYLQQRAGFGFSPPSKIARHLAARGEKVGKLNPKVGGALLVEAIHAARWIPKTPEDTVLFNKAACEVMDRVDTKFGLKPQYGFDLTSPEGACYEHTVEKFANLRHELVACGPKDVYTRTDLVKVNPKCLSVIDESLPLKVACDGDRDKLDPDKLTAEMKRADLSTSVGRVFRGFGIAPVDRTIKQSAPIVPDGEIQEWQRIAGNFGSPLTWHGGGEFSFSLVDGD